MCVFTVMEEMCVFAVMEEYFKMPVLYTNCNKVRPKKGATCQNPATILTSGSTHFSTILLLRTFISFPTCCTPSLIHIDKEEVGGVLHCPLGGCLHLCCCIYERNKMKNKIKRKEWWTGRTYCMKWTVRSWQCKP